ncbi:MAG: response regulator [Verrucomicrobiales bacterium]|nr:response regulator [Verrucomicrobiales bacterium]
MTPNPAALRVLLVEPNEESVLAVQAGTRDSRQPPIQALRAGSLAEALAVVDQEPWDAVLLQLDLPDSKGLETLRRLRERTPHLPFLVLGHGELHTAETDLFREGAHDIVERHQAGCPFLAGAIRRAVERARLLEAQFESRQRDAETQEFLRIRELAIRHRAPVTERIYGGQPLHEVDPTLFEEFVLAYAQLLDAAIESRHFKSDTSVPTSDSLLALGNRLGALRGEPRDVVEIHGRALRSRLPACNPLKARALLEESRLMVLELMGHLTAYYRRYYAGNLGRGTNT